MSEQAFSDWVEAHTGIGGARLAEPLAGGNSNVTRLVETDSGRRLVLRRPPADTISPSAARGVSREFRVLSAVHGSAPVPEPVALCEDASVIGAPFVLVEAIDGVSITDTLPDSYIDRDTTLSAIGTGLVDALAAIHNVEWRAAGLDDFGRPENWVARQIERWRGIRADATARELPLVEELGAWFADTVPAQTEPAIVHGDYHLDNTLFAPDEPRLAAVIDWELSTIGEPMADVGLVLAFWGPRDPSPAGFEFVQAVSRSTTRPDRRDLADRWATTTGRSVENLDWFCAFSLWRLAAIVEGAWVLQAAGKIDSPYARSLEADVPRLLQEAATFARHAGR
jgi:aminoglycoside phosphotransferase (APT) family kinase protein